MPVHRPKLWLLLGALASTGLFAMHGLSGHGISHAAGGAPHHQETAVVQTDHAAARNAPASDSPACDGTCAVSMHGSTSHAPMGESHNLAMALCLAVLALAGMLAGLAVGRFAPSAVGPPGLLPRVTCARSRRDHDPPSIFRLSVQRC